MADVYEIHIGPRVSENAKAVTNSTIIELIDSAGDKDEWHTDNEFGATGTIGEGRGDWIRRGSINQIVLMNNDATAVEGTLNYEKWPLRTGDMGTVKLTKAIKGCPYAGSKTDLSFMVAAVK